MTHRSDLIATDVDAYLEEHERKDLLRFLTCGSVDDGKSTLIGRLLFDSNMIYADHLAALDADSVTSGTTGGEVDLALLMDGLKAEREQGITIDVAYRYFSTARRKFIISDAPGHVQYTRNMVTAASAAQLAIILIDASRGVLDQTRRHSYIASLLGIRHVVVAVNKMDLVGWSSDRFETIRSDFTSFAESLAIEPYFLPVSALTGDNVVEPSPAMPWFVGPPLMEHLETVDVGSTGCTDERALRFPVQVVLRPNANFRGFAGTIASGVVRPGDEVVALPSGSRSTVARIVTFDGDLDEAGIGRAVTLTLADEIDLSRGDLLVAPDHLPSRTHDVDAMIVWMSEVVAAPGNRYILRSGTGEASISLRAVYNAIDVNTLEEVPSQRLELNDIAHCALTTDRELLFDPYVENRTTGSFILIDRLSNATVGAGMIIAGSSPWDREPPDSLHRQRSEITSSERFARLQHHPCTVLLTGMTGSGKSTVAAALERQLFDRGCTVMRLDGQNLRLGISRDLGFTNEDRSENLRRAAEIAALANRHGLISLVAVQSPEAAVRERARQLIGSERFLEVFLDAPEEVRRHRDPNGLYAAADADDRVHLPGVTTDYDVPEAPDLRLDTASVPATACVESLIALLHERGFLQAR